MLTDYIRAAMHKATYKNYPDGTLYGEIPGLQGVWATGPTLEACRDELQEVLGIGLPLVCTCITGYPSSMAST